MFSFMIIISIPIFWSFCQALKFSVYRRFLTFFVIDSYFHIFCGAKVDKMIKFHGILCGLLNGFSKDRLIIKIENEGSQNITH